MREELARALVQTAGIEGYDCELLENYAGRGMWGATTTAIVCDDPGPLIVCAVLHPELFSEQLKHDLSHAAFRFRLHQDNYGSSMVYY